MTWSQNYDPLGGVFLSAAVAAIPVALLLLLLAVWHVRAHVAALCGLAAAAAVAIIVYHMPPALAGLSAVYGAAYGLFPISWIVLNAIFIYEVSVVTHQFEVIKKQVSRLAGDKRLQTLLIAYCFGAFIEGAAGFGAPVAITGALLLGLGFQPMEAAVLPLIGNTAPVAFGSVGIPLIVLNKTTGLDLQALTAMAGRILPPFSFLVPFWLVAVQAGVRGMAEVWPACAVCGGTFALTQLLVSNLHGPWLVDLASALLSMGALVLLLRVWQPRSARAILVVEPRASDTGGARAWLPWILLSACVALWRVPPIEHALANATVSWRIPILNGAIQRMPPVVPSPKFEEVIFKLDWLSATGTALFAAGVISGLLLGVKPRELIRIYFRTVGRVRISLFTISAMLALGYTTRLSGSDTTLGLAFARTGGWFPFFSPLLGWLGVALTGSDTASNVLFGNLQQVTARQLGISPILTTAANTSGGVMGKMIDAQSIVVASVATSGAGERTPAGLILRRVFLHSLALAILVGIWVFLIARILPRWIPNG